MNKLNSQKNSPKFYYDGPFLSPDKIPIEIKFTPNSSQNDSPNSANTKDIKDIKDISLSSINTINNTFSRDLISFYSPEEYIERNRDKETLPLPESLESYEDFRESPEKKKKKKFKKNENFVKIIEFSDIKQDIISENQCEEDYKRILYSSTGDKANILRKEDIINKILEEQDKLELRKDVKDKIQKMQGMRSLKIKE